jgi:Tfp pilus assembly protein PilF
VFSAQFYVAKEMHQKAAELYRTALSKTPNDFDIIFNSANAFR